MCVTLAAHLASRSRPTYFWRTFKRVTLHSMQMATRRSFRFQRKSRGRCQSGTRARVLGIGLRLPGGHEDCTIGFPFASPTHSIPYSTEGKWLRAMAAHSHVHIYVCSTRDNCGHAHQAPPKPPQLHLREPSAEFDTWNSEGSTVGTAGKQGLHRIRSGM